MVVPVRAPRHRRTTRTGPSPPRPQNPPRPPAHRRAIRPPAIRPPASLWSASCPRARALPAARRHGPTAMGSRPNGCFPINSSWPRMARSPRPWDSGVRLTSVPARWRPMAANIASLLVTLHLVSSCGAATSPPPRPNPATARSSTVWSWPSTAPAMSSSAAASRARSIFRVRSLPPCQAKSGPGISYTPPTTSSSSSSGPMACAAGPAGSATIAGSGFTASGSRPMARSSSAEPATVRSSWTGPATRPPR